MLVLLTGGLVMKSTLYAVLALVCCVFLVAAPAQTEKRNEDTTSAEIDTLLRKRRDVFQQILTIVKAQNEENGGATRDAVLQATNQLLAAELQLAKSRDERVCLLQKRVKNFKELEDVAQSGNDSGVVTGKEVPLAKAARLQAEVDLLREKVKSD